MKLLLLTLLASLALPTVVNANNDVKDSLNIADMNFRVGNYEIACMMVSMAIIEVNNPEIYGPTSIRLKREVKRYAKRCDLRF